MGAAGDMLLAALAGLFEKPEEVVPELNSLGIPDVEYKLHGAEKAGIKGRQMSVLVCGKAEGYSHSHSNNHGHREGHHSHSHNHGHGEGHHSHSHIKLAGVENIINSLDIPLKTREDAKAVYNLIAEAESAAHGCPVEQIHFHETGTMDAVADVVGVCYLIYKLGADKVMASYIRTGYGQVQCAHGLLPVPAPATEYLLRGIPVYSGNIEGEMCTPTGAALLKYFVSSFGEMPAMQIERTGYGMGHKDFEAANCVRAMYGTAAVNKGYYTVAADKEQVCVLSCNLDDMTPEAAGFAMEELLNAGALDVYTVPAGMKKNRPGFILNCLCTLAQRQEMLRLMFLHTTTLGIREDICGRYTLERTCSSYNTEYGTVHVKHASGQGVSRSKPEYEDIAGIARREGISLKQAVQKIHID